MIPIMDNRAILEGLLDRLGVLEIGEGVKMENLGFTVFRPYNGELIERKDRRLSGELGIRLMNRGESWFDYDVSSGDKRYILLSEDGWQLPERSIDYDSLSVEPFLRIPLVNFPTGSEARLYIPPNKKSVLHN